MPQQQEAAHEPTEDELERGREQALREVESRPAEMMAAADKRIENIPPSVGLDREKGAVIFERGGFGEKIKAIKEKISKLVSTTKEQIQGLLSAKSHGEIETQPPETNLPSESLPEHQPEKFQEHEIASETQEDKEKREIDEYLQKEVFAKLDLTKEAEDKALAEAPENKREILQRSFQNIRDTIKTSFELDCVEGRIDRNALKLEWEKRRFEVMSPVLEESLKKVQPALAEYGIDVSSASPGFDKEHTDLETLRSKTYEIHDRLKEAIGNKIDHKIASALTESGEYRGVTMPTDEQMKDEQFMDERSNLLKSIMREEEKQQLDTVGFQKWIYETDESLRRLIPTISPPDVDQFRVKKAPQELARELEDNLDKARSTGFISVNMSASKLEQVLTAGQFKDMFALDEQELAEMKREFGRGDEFYFNQREVMEKALGTYDPNEPTIYGTYASENGMDEKRGGAQMYGSIFLKIRREVKVAYCEGDSMSGGGGDAVQRKIQNANINRLDYASYARARQVAPEHVGVAKALLNIEKTRKAELSNEELTSIDYIEAHIKNLKLEDIESINVPKSYATGEKIDFGGESGRAHKQFIEKLLADPQWKDKIKIIDNV